MSGGGCRHGEFAAAADRVDDCFAALRELAHERTAVIGSVKVQSNRLKPVTIVV